MTSVFGNLADNRRVSVNCRTKRASVRSALGIWVNGASSALERFSSIPFPNGFFRAAKKFGPKLGSKGRGRVRKLLMLVAPGGFEPPTKGL